MHLKNAFRFFDKFIFPIISRRLLEIMVIVGRKEDDNYGWR